MAKVPWGVGCTEKRRRSVVSEDVCQFIRVYHVHIHFVFIYIYIHSRVATKPFAKNSGISLDFFVAMF